MSSPIADLSYRHYDGQLDPPAFRWWAIARASMQLSIKKKGFWIVAPMTGWFYLLLLVVFYFVEILGQNIPVGQKNPFLQQIVWKDQFLNAFGMGQLFFFILTAMIGVGTIANDNRANALLVYLSKPCSKADYLIGKWLGIFIPITLSMAAPTLFFFSYCLMTYRNYGVLTEDPYLPMKLLGLILVPGTLHASLALGVSSMFSEGRLAGATYSGLYFFGYFFTTAMRIMSDVRQAQGQGVPTLVNRLFYCSIDGLDIGLAKAILGTDGSQLFPGANGGRRGGPPGALPVPAPELPLALGVVGLVCAIAMLIAWNRVRAVEVVG